ncbi:MAG: hypothetical protein Q9201_003482, partial [Fulgogasparrea decipioides]
PQIRRPGDEGGEIRRRVEGVFDLLAVAEGAVVAPAEEEFQSVAAPTTLERQICEVEDLTRLLRALPRSLLFLTVIRMEKVRSRKRIRGVEFPEIRAEEKGARHGNPHHLVRVDRYAVRQMASLQPLSLRRQRRGEDDRTAPGSVDVQP